MERTKVSRVVLVQDGVSEFVQLPREVEETGTTRDFKVVDFCVRVDEVVPLVVLRSPAVVSSAPVSVKLGVKVGVTFSSEVITAISVDVDLALPVGVRVIEDIGTSGSTGTSTAALCSNCCIMPSRFTLTLLRTFPGAEGLEIRRTSPEEMTEL